MSFRDSAIRRLGGVGFAWTAAACAAWATRSDTARRAFSASATSLMNAVKRSVSP
ncbi:hypothetical protein H4W80_004497 [Nonomuraea angiospora]|uniref:Uncharacterized protein n=1 Tax=Nonomuraea angiospora TaxID=46172 RepID=A0ABR9M010_9ACTN|nr:hypothetical protein [Nonomuraea angiospora]